MKVVAVVLLAVAIAHVLGGYGAPIPAPNLEECHPGIVNGDPRQPIQSCPVPPARPVVDFSWTSLEGWPMRERQAAHLLDAAATARLARAYRLMRRLPDHDPRSLRQQQLLHGAYCSSSLPAPWDPAESLQIHWSWLLLPWHRWFLYFHERILASLLGDPSFALPFWNWDNYLDVDNRRDEEGRFRYLPAMLPRAYFQEEELIKCNRTVARAPPALVNLGFNPFFHPEQFDNPPHLSPEELHSANLNIMHQVMVSGATLPSLFMGQAYRYGAKGQPSPQSLLFGTLEGGPHGNVHVWVGNETLPNFEHMGNIAISAWDPSFYIHHANIDRLWEVWKTIPGGYRRDISDPNWLDSRFVFYDENADLVRVRVGDALDNSKLRVSYQSVPESDAAWITYNATRCANLSHSEAQEWAEELAAAAGFQKSAHKVTVKARKPVTFSLSRPPPPREKGEEWEEVLVLEDVTADWTAPANLAVFLFLPGVNRSNSAACAELAGILTTPPITGRNSKRSFGLRLAVGPKLRQLGLADLSTVPVTLRAGPQHTHLKPIRIGTVRIVWEAGTL